jgi:meso-butanediol dehydrogenase/(S,S)-butanediol dehydrogenase/diacetyl reductase
MMMILEGKVAFVTGAASGIGRATAIRLSAEGAQVLLADIDQAGLDSLCDEIATAGGEAASQHLDVSQAGACRAAIAAAVARFGQLDVLCNIAGIAAANHLADVSDDEWQRMVNINLSGVFYLCQAAMPHLEQTAGNIVNMASSAGLVGQAYNIAYCATKGGVVMMSKAMAMEFASKGVRVNAICPGGIKTPLVSAFSIPEGADMNLFMRMMPLTGEMAEPEQVADVVAFLAADSSRYITGVALPVDGGQVVG